MPHLCSLFRLRAVLALLLASVCAWPLAALAFQGDSLILVNGPLRQLRSARVEVTGTSRLGPKATIDARRAAALADARRIAYERIRNALEAEIDARGSDLGYYFIGERSGEKVVPQRIVAAETAFVIRYEDLPVMPAPPGEAPDANRYGVRAVVDVVYVLTPSARAARTYYDKGQKPLSLSPSGVEPEKRKPFDFKSAYETLEKALKERMKDEGKDAKPGAEGTPPQTQP